MGSRWCRRAAGGAGGLQVVQEGCRWCRRAAGGAGGLQVVQVGCRRCWFAAGGAVGGGVAKQRILSYHMTPVTQAIRSSLFQVQC